MHKLTIYLNLPDQQHNLQFLISGNLVPIKWIWGFCSGQHELLNCPKFSDATGNFFVQCGYWDTRWSSPHTDLRAGSPIPKELSSTTIPHAYTCSNSTYRLTISMTLDTTLNVYQSMRSLWLKDKCIPPSQKDSCFAGHVWYGCFKSYTNSYVPNKIQQMVQ